jgi:prepilin signal peptidase PulO-like enzyme (type II secretory pathway)
VEFLLVFIFGLVFGSFLNVVIYRLKTRQPAGRAAKSIILGRSFCPDCKTTLKWHELVPLLSFIWLSGRCRYCKKKISWQYPIVELLSGLIWVGIFYKVFGNLGFTVPAEALAKAGDFIYYILIFSGLLVIAVYDFKWKIIPDKIIYPAAAIALIYNLAGAFKSQDFWAFIWPLSAAAAVFLFLFSFFYFSGGRAMGLGDAKLGFLIGLFLGPLPAILAVFSAFVVGAVCGIILLVGGQKSLKSQVAFGPFLVIGAIIAFFFYDSINFYFLNF